MEKGKKDDFSLALSNDKHFATYYIAATLLVLSHIMRSDEFKAKCLESYNKAMAERAQNGQ